MTAFILAIFIGLAIFIFSNMKSQHSIDIYSMSKPVVHEWVKGELGDPQTIMYALYNNENSSMHHGATIIVGKFCRHGKKDCGFYLELLDGEIVLGRIFLPEGITSWHKSIVQKARVDGSKVFEVLCRAEAEHHIKYPQWKNEK